MLRIPELDSVRGAAVLIVLVHHLHLRTGTHLDWLLEHGWMAVDLFFILSGYLITTIIISNQTNAEFFRSFYIRRSLRIWPIYYLSILALLALPLVWHAAPQFQPRSLLQYLTFTQEAPLYWSTEPHAHPLLGHFWSLAVEEQFYLIWPLVVAVIGRRGIVPAGLGLIGLAIAARSVGFHRHLLISRCDALAAGAILAVLTAHVLHGRRRSVLVMAFAATVLASLLTFAAAVVFVDRSIIFQDSMLMFVTPCLFGLLGLVICLQGHPHLAGLRTRALCYCGTISYGLYVYHWIIYLIFDRAIPDSSHTLWATVLKVALSFLIAVLSWRFLERPILSLKDRFGYRHADGDRPSTAGSVGPAPTRLSA
jgi:peptidoglycan/LPS O-acetylase OafA/YrhL